MVALWNMGTDLQDAIIQLAQQFPDTQDTHGSRAVSQYQAKGALAMAREGYNQLFADWLPFLSDLKPHARIHIPFMLRAHEHCPYIIAVKVLVMGEACVAPYS